MVLISDRERKILEIPETSQVVREYHVLERTFERVAIGLIGKNEKDTYDIYVAHNPRPEVMGHISTGHNTLEDAQTSLEGTMNVLLSTTRGFDVFPRNAGWLEKHRVQDSP